MPPRIRAAGAVVHRQSAEGKTQFLLVHRPRYEDWTLPKGKLAAGETARAAARREVFEEAGVRSELGPELGATAYRTRAGRTKKVRYWMMEAGEVDFQPNREVDQILWLSGKKAMQRVDYNLDRSVLSWARTLVKDPEAGRIYLIHPAQARKRWKGIEIERPVSNLGRSQAVDLIEILGDYPVARIVSSRLLRCTQTIARLGIRLTIDVTEDPALDEGAPRDSINDLLSGLAGTSAALCPSSDVVDHVLRLARNAGADLDGPDEPADGSVWVLDTREGEVVSGTYLEPLAP